MNKSVLQKFFKAYNIEKVDCKKCKKADYCSHLKLDCSYYDFVEDAVGFPQITDTVLLKLICFNNSYWASTDETIFVKNFDTLLEETLKKLTKCSDKEHFYNGVREILGVE